MGKAIGVISLKGGVGKTSAVVSIGSALSEQGKSVLLVDGNLSSPSLGLHLGIVEPNKTLHHVLSHSTNPKDAIYQAKGMDILPASITGGKINSLALRDKIKLLKKNYDVVLIDSAPSLDDETLSVVLSSDQILGVTTPDHPTLSATIRVLNIAKKRGASIAGVVINKVHDKDFEISLDKIEETIGAPVLAVIPYDTKVLHALSNMEPSPSFAPRSRGSIEYKKLAAALVGEKYNTFSFRNLFGFTPKKEEVNRELFYKSVFEN